MKRKAAEVAGAPCSRNEDQTSQILGDSAPRTSSPTICLLVHSIPSSCPEALPDALGLATNSQPIQWALPDGSLQTRPHDTGFSQHEG